MIRSCGALLQKPHNILSARHVAKQLSESEEITYRTTRGERLIVWRERNYTHGTRALRILAHHMQTSIRYIRQMLAFSLEG